MGPIVPLASRPGRSMRGVRVGSGPGGRPAPAQPPARPEACGCRRAGRRWRRRRWGCSLARTLAASGRSRAFRRRRAGPGFRCRRRRLAPELMMLTAGIELAEGKSNLADPAAADPLGAIGPGPADAAGAVRQWLTVAAARAARADATAGLLPFDCHASACAPSDVSKARTFMLATTRAGSCSSRSSAQSAPLQPRVISTWATKP